MYFIILIIYISEVVNFYMHGNLTTMNSFLKTTQFENNWKKGKNIIGNNKFSLYHDDQGFHRLEHGGTCVIYNTSMVGKEKSVIYLQLNFLCDLILIYHSCFETIYIFFLFN